jgi:hypothetical protein
MRLARLASLDGFTLHAATRAGALHLAGREALLRYVLRPPIAQRRFERGAGDFVRIALKRAYADGTGRSSWTHCRCFAGSPPAAGTQDAELSPKHARRYRAWTELLKRTFDIDVLECLKCHRRMKLLAMITDGTSVEQYLTKLGEPTDVPDSSASRWPKASEGNRPARESYHCATSS